MADKSKIITPALPRGMRDQLPDQLAIRYKVIETIRRVFKLYGFQPLETPAMERLEILSGKGGEESDKLSFLVMKRGAELERALEKVKAGAAPVTELADMGLRYDLTVPLARVVAMYRDKLPMPFKRYQIAPVWRADRPQHGRYREFTQCDVDIVGTDSPVADVEIISLLLDGLDAIRTEFALRNFDFVVKVNHRGLLKQWSAIMGNRPEQFDDFCIALDKIDKIGRTGVIQEMQARGLAIDKMSWFWEMAEQGNQKQNWNDIGLFLKTELGQTFDDQPFDDLRKIVWHNDLMSRAVDRDFTLARGLAYYTGSVFEVVDRNRVIGSLGGGGRYDGLVGLFSKQQIPAVGASFGIDRIIDLIVEETGKTLEMNTIKVIVVDYAPEIESHNLSGQIIKSLRMDNISCEHSYKCNENLGKQLEATVKRGADFAIITDEKSRREFGSVEMFGRNSFENIDFNIKRLSTGEQRRLTIEDAIKWIKETQ